MPNFRFAHALPTQRPLIHTWLKQPHICAWIHGTGLQNTLTGLENFFTESIQTQYWIGYDGDTPFAFLITSPYEENAITLDVFICDPNYLGKGYAAAMIQQFLLSQFSQMKKVIIDPEKTNSRAIHVYEKVGFKIVGEFIANWHPVPHLLMELSLSDLRMQNPTSK